MKLRRPHPFAFLSAAVTLAAMAATHDAGACSCVGPQLVLVGPSQVDDAPLNTKVRVETPSGGYAGGGGNVVLRVHGGANVATTSRTLTPGGWLATVELTPNAPLAPSTQYEVAVVDPSAHPSTTVLGAFKTGTAADTTAPRLDSVGNATVFRNPNAMGSACQVPGPWVQIDAVTAEDPGRPGARLLFGVWLGDAAGNVDPKKPPTGILSAHNHTLHLGQQSVCDPHSFPVPKAGIMWVGIAALDEAGNASAMRKVKADIGAAKTP